MFNKLSANELSNYKQVFDETGYVRIANFFPDDIANELAQLFEALPWELAYLMDASPKKIKVEELQRQGPQAQAELFARIRRYASENAFSFAYDTYMLVTKYIENNLQQPLLRRYVEMLVEPSFVQFMRDLTGDQGIIKADAQASRYLPGHFLSTHNDDGSNVNHSRVAAYTLSLSKNWQNEWGGILHLLDDEKAIQHSLVPEFNTLTVFKVPRMHFVSQVANYCPKPRHSIVGWFRKDLN